MSFESKMKNRGNKNLNKYAKNPYHKSRYDHIPLWSKIAIPVSLVAISSAFVAMMVLPKISNSNGKINMQDSTGKGTVVASNSVEYSGNQAEPSSYPYSLVPGAQGSSYAQKPWEERAINDQYRMLLYNDANYYSYLYPSIESQYIGEPIGDALVFGDETTFQNNMAVTIRHETTVTLYKVNGFNPSLVLAVKFNEDDGYYWYKNISDSEYYQTMSEFLNKIDLNEVASFPYAFYDCEESGKRSRYQYNDINKELVLNCFFSNPDAQFFKEVEIQSGGTVYYSQYTNYISIPIYMPRLHLETSSNGASGFSIYDNGFLELTFLNKKDMFYVGEEAYQTFKDYLLNNLTGELL